MEACGEVDPAARVGDIRIPVSPALYQRMQVGRRQTYELDITVTFNHWKGKLAKESTGHLLLVRSGGEATLVPYSGPWGAKTFAEVFKRGVFFVVRVLQEGSCREEPTRHSPVCLPLAHHQCCTFWP